MDSQWQFLTHEQVDLFKRIFDAALALPSVPAFECHRIGRYPFAWIVHEGLHKGVIAASWGDLDALECHGLIQMTGNDPGNCTFVLTAHAKQLDGDQLPARAGGRQSSENNGYDLHGGF